MPIVWIFREPQRAVAVRACTEIVLPFYYYYWSFIIISSGIVVSKGKQIHLYRILKFVLHLESLSLCIVTLKYAVSGNELVLFLGKLKEARSLAWQGRLRNVQSVSVVVHLIKATCRTLERVLIFFLILSAFAKFREATVSFLMSVRACIRPSAWNNSVSTGQILSKFYIWNFFFFFFENLSRKFKFH